MALSVGNNNVAGMSVGTDEVASAYWGNSEVWSSAPAANMCTVANLGAQDPSTVTFTDTGSINYDFEEVTVNGNVFVKIPTFYRKVETVVDNQITSFTLADAKVDNNYQPYPCFLKPNGDLMDYVLIGKYCISSTSQANSVNATPAGLNIQNARSLARAVGTGYQLYDWQINKLLQDVFLCSIKRVDFCNASTNLSEYLKVCNLNVECLMDGFGVNNYNLYISYKPDSYVNSPTSSSTNYVTVQYLASSSGSYVSKLGYDVNNAFFNFASEASGSSWSEYYCSYANMGKYASPIRFQYSGVAAHKAYGLWRVGYNGTGNWTGTYRFRLCYRPL